ncbi:hypothetical protein [Pseudoxanthomonas sp. Root630]|uniref:hypothetical protein n=1 Tax=Pseudoxanthomonas sp. Root630 TaxID=1736574 RepID=UPI000A4466C3|nr:hypothetical protein [Pseudoxanthomonas sp. Root630]
MLRSLLLASCVALALPVSARAQAATDLASLIECRGDIAGLSALAPALEDPLKAVALGWQPLPQANMFMTEYRLASPIRVFGHDTGHIAFSGGSVMAILDLPDPRPLAKELALETAIDTPAKAMFGKELRSEETRDATSGKVLIESVVLNVSNVASHPGKTLAGCSYSLDLPEDAPEDEAPAAPATVTQPG